jgi:hypothetical protein
MAQTYGVFDPPLPETSEEYEARIAQEERDKELYTTVVLLVNLNQHEAASLLAEGRLLDFEWGSAYDEDFWVAMVELSVEQLSRVTDELTNQILDALNTVHRNDGYSYIGQVRWLPALITGDPRTFVRETCEAGPSNQAALAPLGPKSPTCDRLRFRDSAEVMIYEALKRCQALKAVQDPHGNLLILPNPGARRHGQTIEPDFAVAYRGRIGVIEVDGCSHRGRRAADRSRDRLLEDAGIAYVDRVTAEDVKDADSAWNFVVRFLKRLKETA